ncbi:MAG TPA: autotransporter domain-containing protein [Rhodocyclaceae bacterium]|nr:autotransporter domain-containing protein [Rhodocyclaceae bacterium]
MRAPRHLRLIPVVLALQVVYPVAHAASCSANSFTVASGGTLDEQTICANDTATVQSGGSVSVTDASAGTLRNGILINGSGATINNYGTISNTATLVDPDNDEASAIRTDTAFTSLTVTNNAGATISSLYDDAIHVKKNTGMTVVNYGTITSGSSSVDGGQGVDFGKDSSAITNTVYNHASGVIQAYGENAIKLGAGGIVYNDGTIQTLTSTVVASQSAMDFGTNTGAAIYNATNGATTVDASSAAGTGSIIGTQHGIEGGDATLTTAFTATVVNGKGGTIEGLDGSGINIDNAPKHPSSGSASTGSNETVNVTNYGIIRGNGVTGDGDGIDVDGVVNVTNGGTIISTKALNDTSEGITVGGGTITNLAGGLIEGDNINGGAGVGITLAGVDSGSTVTGGIEAIYQNSTINNYGTIRGQTDYAIRMHGTETTSNTVTINNYAGGVIEGGGTSHAAIYTLVTPTIINNAGTIQADSSGKAIDFGNSTGSSLTVTGGSAKIIGDVIGSTVGDTTVAVTPGTGNTFSYGYSMTGLASLDIGAGTTSFNGTTSVSGATTIAAGGTFQANGAFSTGDLAVNGTFKTASDTSTRTISVGSFSLGASGTLEAGISGTGNDQIIASGTATITNGATITPVAKGYVVNGATYTIVSAGTLAATPANINVTNSAMIDYAVSTSGNDLILTATRTGGTLASVASSGGSSLGALGSVLDTLGTSGNSAMSSLLGTLDSLSTQDQVRSAIKQLQPETNHASQQAAQTAMGSLFSAVGDRIDVARSGGNFASAGNSGVSTGDAEARGRVWLQGLGAWGKQDARAGADGYRINAYGMAGGLETDLSAREVAGVTVGYTRAGTRGSDTATGNDVDVDAFNIGGYMGRDMGGWTLDTSLMAGRNHYSSTRVVNFLGETVHGSYDGWQIGARVEAGLPFDISKTWSGRWLAGLRASHLGNQGYTESGDPAVAQNVASSSANSVQPTLGVEFNRVGENGGRLQLRARYLHELASDPSVTASFVAGGPSFVTPGASQNRDALQFGTSYRWNNANGSFATVGYDAEVRDRSLVNQVTARMGWLF